MDQIRLELDNLGRLLHDELSCERQPVRLDCQKCVHLTHELAEEQKKLRQSVERVSHLEKQVLLNRELKEENISLKKQLVRDTDNPSYQSVVGELAIEKQRRIRAEQELEIYRKQGKTTDEKVAANAKRVAIALAQHCLELSHELQKIRESKRETDDNRVEPHEAARNLESSLEPPASLPKVAGWGIDDDIFDESN